MQNIKSLAIYLDNIEDSVIENLKHQQSNTAFQIQQDVKYFAPNDTGKYKETIEISETTYDGSTISTEIYTDATVSTIAGTTYNLGRLLEEGTSPHEIRAVNKMGLFWGKYDDNGNPVIVKSVMHPGSVAQPHFYPALEKNKKTYRDNIKRAIKEAK